MAAARSPSCDDVADAGGPPPAVSREGGRTVVSLYGEQDTSTAADLAAALVAAGAAGDGDVVVDLSEVGFMDAAIIAELARGRNALHAQSRALMLRAPSRFALRLLDVCGLVGSDPTATVRVLPQVVSRPPTAVSSAPSARTT